MPVIRIAYYSDDSAAVMFSGHEAFNVNPSGYNEIVVEQALIDNALNPADVLKDQIDLIVTNFKSQIDLAFTPAPVQE